jgi:ADP-ribosyl-[dinitrogen reductase] hydrolase
MAEIMLRALRGLPKAQMLAPSQQDIPWTAAMQSLANADYQTKTEQTIEGTGYVVKSLEAALWCFYNTDTFETCVLKAANLGDDADTTAAIAGQIAGAFYGETAIPTHWKKQVTMASEIGQIAQQLSAPK